VGPGGAPGAEARSRRYEPAIAAAGDPELGQGDKCIVENRQFCWHWFVHNFGSRYQPRLVEHIELTPSRWASAS